MNKQNGIGVVGATPLSVIQALNKIQGELKAPKAQRNSFGNYNYRSCEDILEAVKPLLGEAILIISDEIVPVGDRFYVKATATLKLNGDCVSTTAYAREATAKKGMDEAQITGASSSYARKYALNGLFCIDDTKDADATHNGKTNGNGEYIDTQQQNQIIDLLTEIEAPIQSFLDYMKVESVERIPKDKFKQALVAIENRKKKVAK